MWGDSIVGFGSHHYKYASGREGDWFVIGFSPRKQNLTLYPDLQCHGQHPVQSLHFVWLFMTVVFEFIFGHYVMGHPWSKLFHDYNLLAGRVWLLVLLWTTMAPYLFYRLQDRQASAER